ncbi:MAG: hypothetical protein IKR57_02595 [Bacilli bacterium]|nr:hypothetical protein [Bacilli bacterium]
MNEYVSIKGIKNLSNILDARRESIKKIYENELIVLLEECNELYGISLAGYDELYSNINSKLIMLSNLLEGGISHDYEELVDNLKSIFTNDFNSKFNELMNDKTEE